jgi:uncharacterized membrane protein (DUF485 family)
MFALSFAFPALAARARCFIATPSTPGAWTFDQPAASGHILTAGF